MASELEEAIVEVKRQLGVTTAPANEIAIRLPEHLRSAFWEQAVEYYFADQMALLDAVEEAGFIAAAEQRGRQWAIDALRDLNRWAKWCAETIVAAGVQTLDIRQPTEPADYLENLRDAEAEEATSG